MRRRSNILPPPNELSVCCHAAVLLWARHAKGSLQRPGTGSPDVWPTDGQEVYCSKCCKFWSRPAPVVRGMDGVLSDAD